MATLKCSRLNVALSTVAILSLMISGTALADDKPNILFIMGDDIGIMQPSIYHEGLMVGETPNLWRGLVTCRAGYCIYLRLEHYSHRPVVVAEGTRVVYQIPAAAGSG